ncbi:MAG TPA: glutamate--tRNA ligase [Actinomycetota bacterium]|nr:glutamate--tRNA ligase [Actinomycetota bacterium]
MTSPVQNIRTRFAPAPSGSLHVGNGRTALFAWLFARRHEGTFVLRVEDTDASRATEEHMHGVMDVLRWLGLDWDEGPDVGGPYGPYRQSERYDLYRERADAMVASGTAYACYCTPEELDERRKAALKAGKTPGYDRRCLDLSDPQRAAFASEGRAPAIRFMVPEGETAFEDLVRGEVRFDHASISDFIILRADRSPTYLLAAATDDMEMKMTHVVRGEDLMTATPRQMMLFAAMGVADVPRYAHLPLIVGSDRQPLSKRHGVTAIEHYRDNGFLPEALINYLALLGWSLGDGVTEKFSRDELIKYFTLENVSRNPAAFDIPKLTAINGDYIRELAPEEFARRLAPYLEREGLAPDDSLLAEIVPLIQERMQLLTEAAPMIRFFFIDAVEPDEQAAAWLVPEYATALERYVAVLEALPEWRTEAIKDAMFGVQEALGLKKKAAFMPVRAAVTGAKISPPLFESLEVLGRERSLGRIRAGLERARAG